MSRGKQNRTELGARLAVGIGAAALCAFTFVGCAKRATSDAPPPPMPVSVVRLKTQDVPVSGEWVGTLDGLVNASIQPQVSGYLLRQDYKEGSQVAKGQVLFEIDPRPFQAALAQAEGQLRQAEGQVSQTQAQLDLAQINVERDTPLAQAHAIAQSILDNDRQQRAQQQAALESAQASVAAAQAAVDNARLNLGFTQVRSLINGVAGQATSQVGNLVSPQSVLTSVSQLNPIKAYFSISDSEYLALAAQAGNGKGNLLKASSGIPVTLVMSNGKTFGEKGHIDFLDRQINSQTGAIRVAAVFPNPGNLLRPGQFGRISAVKEIRHDALLLPQVAVVELQGMQQVFVAGADGKAHLTTVQLGKQIGDDWLVLGGVEPGARVITDNVQKLQDGAAISPHQASTTTSDAAGSNSAVR